MIDTTTPLQITAGNSVSWQLALPDFPASSGWSVTYHLLNATNKISFSSTAETDDHLLSIAAATTAGWAAGEYKYTVLASDGTDRETVESGTIEVLPDPAELTTYDGRTHAEICLQNIELVLQGKASKDVLRYEINGRSLENHPWRDLIAMRDYYRAEVAAEKASASGKKNNAIKVRFR